MDLEGPLGIKIDKKRGGADGLQKSKRLIFLSEREEDTEENGRFYTLWRSSPEGISLH